MSSISWTREPPARKPISHHKPDGTFDWDRMEMMDLGAIGPALRDLHERMKKLEATNSEQALDGMSKSG